MKTLGLAIAMALALAAAATPSAWAQAAASRVQTCQFNGAEPPRVNSPIRCHARGNQTTLEALYQRGWRLIQVVPNTNRATFVLYLDKD